MHLCTYKLSKTDGRVILSYASCCLLTVAGNTDKFMLFVLGLAFGDNTLEERCFLNISINITGML